MKPDPRLASVPCGRTCPGVYHAVIAALLESGEEMTGGRILDIPCGDGELISSLRIFFPGAEVCGSDLINRPEILDGTFEQCDASRPFTLFGGRPFDLILSVSGVMEFDNTLQFFENCREHLRPGGRFIVTNDNVSAVWDRLLYLLLGKVRRFPLYPGPADPTWKLLPVQNMVRLLQQAGFEIHGIRYLSSGWSDWLLLPLALLIYPGQALHRRFNRGGMPPGLRREMFPFRSLLGRHYIVFCEKPL